MLTNNQRQETRMIYELFEDLKAEIDGYDVQSIAYTSGVSDQTIYN